MSNFWEGLGIALIIIACSICFRGCMLMDKPLIGPDGSFISINNGGGNLE